MENKTEAVTGESTASRIGYEPEKVNCEVCRQKLAERLARIGQRGPYPYDDGSTGGIWQFRCVDCDDGQADAVGWITIATYKIDAEFEEHHPDVGFSDLIQYVHEPNLHDPLV
jgi:hypothetical protein